MKCEICDKETPYLIKKDIWIENGDGLVDFEAYVARCKEHFLEDQNE